jgi:hypothetical protein
MKPMLIVHPLLFALAPVLFVFARSMHEYPPSVMVLPALAALAAGMLLWGLLRLILKSWRTSAIVASVLLVAAVAAAGAAKPPICAMLASGGPTLLVVAAASAAAGFVLAVIHARRSRGSFGRVTAALNVAAICVTVLPAFTVTQAWGWGLGGRPFVQKVMDPPWASIPTKSPSPRPSIFYIILDGYGSPENLKSLYGCDVSGFTDHLRSRGFRVAGKARCNYSTTFMSIASSLNMRYVDEIDEPFNRRAEMYQVADGLIGSSWARRFLAREGYAFVSLESGYYATEIHDADTYVAPRRWWGARWARTAEAFFSYEAAAKASRERMLFEFGRLGDLARSDKPLFVFAHILAPYPPYVFARDGSLQREGDSWHRAAGEQLINTDSLTRREDECLYTEQAAFVNDSMERVVDGILANSKTPPIIIIQGDHGGGAFMCHASAEETFLVDRMSILSAYYLPGGENAGLYDAITPVNSLRIVFNHYFGTHFAILPDRCYFVMPLAERRLVEVTDRVGGAEDLKVGRRLQASDYFDVPSAGGARTVPWHAR